MTPVEFDAWLLDADRRPLVMGILNVTPDSFSDGGQFQAADAALARAQEMASHGADLIDIGAESTRPGAVRVPAEEQLLRLAPVLRHITAAVGARITLSIDTSLARVAERALDLGAHIVNDVSAGRDDPGLLPMVARRQAPVILMHMPRQPHVMQIAPHYDDVVREVIEYLSNRIGAAIESGIPISRVLIDPGIGFGKTTGHDLELLRSLKTFHALGRPVVLGTSRKKFIAALTGARDRERVFGTAATVAWGVANGADVLRVHDVEAMSQVVRMVRAIQNGDL